jgi:hypothetical protein
MWAVSATYSVSPFAWIGKKHGLSFSETEFHLFLCILLKFHVCKEQKSLR